MFKIQNRNWSLAFAIFEWLLKEPFVCVKAGSSLLAAGVLGDGFGALADSVLGQLTRQKEANSGLDLPRGDGGFLVVVSQAGSLASDTLEDIIDEGVHDAHGLAGDTSVGMDLLHDLVDVDGVAFLPPPVPFLLVSRRRFLAGLLTAFASNWCFGWHDSKSVFARCTQNDEQLDETLLIVKRRLDQLLHGSK